MKGYDIPCPIWGPEYRATVYSDWIRKFEIDIDEVDLIGSDRAGGAYRITRPAFYSIRNNKLREREKARLTTWLVDRRKQGIAEPIVTDAIVESFESTGNKRDLPVSERANRLLRFIAERTEWAGSSVSIPHHTIVALAKSESITWNEFVFLLQYLEKRSWISNVNVSGDFIIYVVAVTVEGYSQIEELSTSPNSSQAFVAMWFSDEMNEAYEKGFENAIRDAGYEPMRIDQKPNVEKIDDEIIAEIRRSRFLVADMTHGKDGARGGVYFEAGFALGLGLPVLYSCRSDMVDKLHFDTRQYYHIVWETPEELHRELVKRIGAVVGDGPL